MVDYSTEMDDKRGLAICLLKLESVIETQGLTEIVVWANQEDQAYLEACQFIKSEDPEL